MSIIETVVIFVVIPAVVVAIVVGLVYGGGTKRVRRYRPGRPFEFTPVWFLSSPELLSGTGNARGAGNPGNPGDRAVSGADRLALSKTGAEAGSEVTESGGRPRTGSPDATGGASDRW